MPYIAFQHSHTLFAYLSIIATLLWSVAALRAAQRRDTTMTGVRKGLYIANRATTGMAALTGLGLMLMGPWRVLVFPYLGLAAFIVHGLCATASRRGMLAGDAGRVMGHAVAQNLILWVSAWLMIAKPF
ncbi:MAG: hypothetical protein QM639_18235 [Rhodocyclaceae bacterium]